MPLTSFPFPQERNKPTMNGSQTVISLSEGPPRWSFLTKAVLGKHPEGWRMYAGEQGECAATSSELWDKTETEASAGWDSLMSNSSFRTSKTLPGYTESVCTPFPCRHTSPPAPRTVTQPNYSPFFFFLALFFKATESSVKSPSGVIHTTLLLSVGIRCLASLEDRRFCLHASFTSAFMWKSKFTGSVRSCFHHHSYYAGATSLKTPQEASALKSHPIVLSAKCQSSGLVVLDAIVCSPELVLHLPPITAHSLSVGLPRAPCSAPAGRTAQPCLFWLKGWYRSYCRW